MWVRVGCAELKNATHVYWQIHCRATAKGTSLGGRIPEQILSERRRDRAWGWLSGIPGKQAPRLISEIFYFVVWSYPLFLRQKRGKEGVWIPLFLSQSSSLVPAGTREVWVRSFLCLRSTYLAGGMEANWCLDLLPKVSLWSCSSTVRKNLPKCDPLQPVHSSGVTCL